MGLYSILVTSLSPHQCHLVPETLHMEVVVVYLWQWRLYHRVVTFIGTTPGRYSKTDRLVQRFQTNRDNKPLSTTWKTPSFLRNPQQWWSGVDVLTCMWGRFSEMWRLSVRIIFTSDQILLHFCISRYHLCISICWGTLKTYQGYHTTVFVLQSVVTGGAWIMKWDFSY